MCPKIEVPKKLALGRWILANWADVRRHGVRDMLRQRVYALALGGEDLLLVGLIDKGLPA